ncbi:MAG: hypothetical protein SGI73_05920 [Chloroflexota bacterium]|nr:hypothetical protein [Chloroflexota bacterium]
MDTVEITLRVPADLAAEARDAGLLRAENLIEWLRFELERRHALADLRTLTERLTAMKPSLTQEDIDAEIEAARRERA